MKVQPFDPYGDRLDLGKKWEKWMERFERDLKYNGIDASLAANSDMARMALLMYSGTHTEDIHDTIPETVKPEGVQDADWTDYAKSKAKLNAYFSPIKSNDFALFELMNVRPGEDEKVSMYVTRLRKAAEKCDFADWSAQKMIKCVLISNMSDDAMRLKFLKKEHTLEEIIDAIREKEDAEARSKVIEKEHDSEGVNKVNSGKSDNNKDRVKENTGKDKLKTTCTKCGYNVHYRGKCPAKDQVCNFCDKRGHYESVCFNKKKKKQQAKAVTKEESESSETESEDGSVAAIERVNKIRTLMKVVTKGVTTKWQPDTGTDRDLMDEPNMLALQKRLKKRIKLRPSNISLYAYGSNTKLDILGCFEATLKAGDKEIQSTIYVTKEKSPHPLLSEQSAKALGLVAYNEKFRVKKVEETKGGKTTDAKDNQRKRIKEILKDNQEIFSGKIGKFTDGQISLLIDKSVEPVVQKCRPIPDNLREKAEKKIEKLIENDVVEMAPVDVPRTWVSPPHIAPKPGEDDVRFCKDMRMANTAIQRPYTQLPTIGDITSKFEGCTKYSKIDLKEAYHQFELDEQSRDITTFYGPNGLMRYKRLNYGTKSAQDHMQIELQRCLAGIPMQINISDDILIGGHGDEEHDEALAATLERIREKGLTVKVTKCIFDVNEVTFAGLVFNADGIRPAEKNVRNLKQAPMPTNKAELRSFLGLATYSERFIPSFATIVAPLRELLKENKKWAWSQEHDKAFADVKNSLSTEALLHHYVVKER